MSKNKFLLDFGHGGMIGGNYVTAPNKMHTFPDGLTIYEGVINRLIGHKLAALLKEKNIDHHILTPGEVDVPLAIRVRDADRLYADDKRCILLSIHSNAGGGKGFEVFTYFGSSAGTIADVFCQEYINKFPQFPFRKGPNSLHKEANFYILRKSDCPALLVENLFFDNRQEAEFLLSDDGQNQIAECLLGAILRCEILE